MKTIIELIKEEVIKQKNENLGSPLSVCNDILSFIEDLQEKLANQACIKIWIARDEAHADNEEFDLEHYLERYPEKEYEFGNLHLFYDKPEYRRNWPNPGKWEGGRIASTIPAYMFPNIKCETCLEFEAPLVTLSQLQEGIIINKETENYG